MIESISIASLATFGIPPSPSVVLNGPSQINFVYGSPSSESTSPFTLYFLPWPEHRISWLG